MPDKSYLKKYGYEITGDPDKPDHPYHYDREMNELLEDTIDKVHRRGGEMVEKLNKLTIRYPNVPHFRNYLSTAYRISGKFEKAEEVNEQLLRKHPDYLFGRINKALSSMEAGEYEKVPEYLGEYMEIKMLYPERKIFHTSEVLTFNKIAVLYFIGIDDEEQAKIRLDIMKDIDNLHLDTRFADRSYSHYSIEKSKEELKIIKQKLWKLKTQSKNAPQFQNPEIWELYEYDLLIDHDIIRHILALPRESVIADLELLLDDCMERFDYYKDLDFEWTSEHSCAPTHAIFMLAELKSKKSLPKILEIFGKDKEFLDYWFGEYLYELIWEPVMTLGNKQLPALKAFVLNSGRDKYARSAISIAVAQLALHWPERRAEAIEWYREIMEYYLEHPEDADDEDAGFLGFLVDDVLTIAGMELSELLEKLYDAELPDEFITGYDEVLTKLETPEAEEIRKHPLLNIYDRYTEVITTWSGYKRTVPSETNEPDLFTRTPDFSSDRGFYQPANPKPVQNDMIPPEPKVGRNDPCPCGSGKKYKKCHGF